MHRMHTNVLPHEAIKRYLPDKNGKHLRVEQPYVVSIIAKIEPNYLEALISGSHSVRQPQQRSRARLAPSS